MVVRSATTPADDQHFLGERESKGRGFCENEEGGGGIPHCLFGKTFYIFGLNFRVD